MFEMLGHNLAEEEVCEWLLSDKHDMGYAHLTDDEIVSNVIHAEDEDSASDDEATTKETEASSISHVYICWLQQQEACLYNVHVLQELRELAARKRMSAIKQRKFWLENNYVIITNYMHNTVP